MTAPLVSLDAVSMECQKPEGRTTKDVKRYQSMLKRAAHRTKREEAAVTIQSNGSSTKNMEAVHDSGMEVVEVIVTDSNRKKTVILFALNQKEEIVVNYRK